MLPLTASISLMKIVNAQSIMLRQPEGYMEGENLTLSIPFYFKNSGFYELSDLQLNLAIKMRNETLSSSSKMFKVEAGQAVSLRCNFSLSFKELAKNKELLVEDSSLNVNASLSFKVASALGLNVSVDAAIPWGAPFHNLSIESFSYSQNDGTFSAALSFSNHASYTLKGPLSVEVYTFNGELLKSDVIYLNVPSGNSYICHIKIKPDNAQAISHGGIIKVYFMKIQVYEKELRNQP